MNYNKPEFKIMTFMRDDIINTSNVMIPPAEIGENPRPIIPTPDHEVIIEDAY